MEKIRCKYSKKGKQFICLKYPDRCGYIVGETRDQLRWKIIWDNTVSKASIHKLFIDKIETHDT